MPRARNPSRLDDILRDEAKAMLGRTPVHGWLKPERVELLTKRVHLPQLRKSAELRMPLIKTAADYLAGF